MIKRLRNFTLSEKIYPLLILMICIFAYGFMSFWLKFYADDWIFLWTWQQQGIQGLRDYFSTTRPFLEPLFSVMLTIVGKNPFLWQLLKVFSYWMLGLSSWWFIKTLWKNQKILAIWVSLLVCVYPGSLYNAVSISGWHRNFIFATFFISLTLTLQALRNKKYFWLFTISSLLLSAYNMLAMEYYFFLELLRPLLIMYELKKKENKRWGVLDLIINSLPYVMIFSVIGLWRLFIFPYQTHFYHMILLDRLKNSPLKVLSELFRPFFYNIWISTFRSWGNVFSLPIFSTMGRLGNVLYFAGIVSSFFICMAFLSFQNTQEPEPREKKMIILQALGLVLLSLFLAGWPFLLTNLVPSLDNYSTRFNSPYTFATCLLVAGLVFAIPSKKWVKNVVLCLLICFSVGKNIQISNEMRIDWKRQNRFFWQLIWRIPQLDQGTLIISNHNFYSFNLASSNTYILNYLLAPQNHSDQLSYAYVDSLESPNILNNNDGRIDFIGTEFHVDARKVLVLANDNSCIQIVDPSFLFEQSHLDTDTAKFASLSNPFQISSTNNVSQVPPPIDIFGPEPEHTWCYYYLKADLSRQNADWENVIQLEEKALIDFGFPESNPRQLFPLIEGWALQGNWRKVQELFLQAYQFESTKLDSIVDESIRLLEFADLNQAYFSFWDYLDTHSLETETKPAARLAILSAIQTGN